jgi:hypothetical protein
MEQFAAGVVPYTFLNGNIYFLLGLEKSNNTWSGFVGKSENGEVPQQTALREFNEETMLLFQNVPFIKKQINGTLPVIDTTKTGKTAYIWFVKFPESYMDISQFHTIHLEGKQFNEKRSLKWFSLNCLQRNKVLYRLKKMILYVYYRTGTIV